MIGRYRIPLIMRQQPTKFLRNPFILLGLFILMLLAGRAVWYMHYTPPEHPEAVGGVLDMRGWDFEHSRVIPLDGEWTFYPDRLLTESDLKEDASIPSRYMQTPGDWREAWPERGDSYGYGTYRLRILVDGPLNQPYGFWFNNVLTSSRVEINGEELALIGTPGEKKSDYTPNVRSYTVSYPLENGREIDLLVHISNFDNPREGGFQTSIRFGSQAAIDTERWYSIGFQLVTFVVFLLHALYALILFAINPRQKMLLVAVLLLFFAGMTVVTANDRLLLNWLPLTFTARVKVSLLSYVYETFFILTMTLQLVGVRLKNTAFRLYAAAVGLYTLFLCFASAQSVYDWFHAFGALYLLPFAAVLVLFVKKVRRDGRDVLLLMAATSVVFSVAGGTSFFAEALPSEYYYPLDMIAALISFSAYWFKNYFRNAEENIRLNEKLRRNDKLKDEFLAHTAHELRTPLHGMISLAQTVLGEERAAIRPRNAANVELLLDVGRRMSQLVGDLLEMSRLQEKRVVLRAEPLTLQSVAPGIFRMLAYLADAKGLRLRMDVPDSFPPVFADEKRLVQILYNLLHNAIKYSDTGTIVLSAEANGRMACVHVSDSGIGMDDETQARIFQAYEQGAQEAGGIGLGLAISKQLTELHGGQLTVRSEPGHGSTFTFTIPLASADVLAMEETAAAREEREAPLPSPDPDPIESEALPVPAALAEPAVLPGADAPTILIVDDDPLNLKVLTNILEAERYRVIPASSGREALAKLGTASWDLAIIDVMMPHMSGYELTCEIRKQYAMSELPILLLTARSQPADIYAGFSSGANDYVAKPVDTLELKYRIRALVALKQSVNERLRMEAAYLQAQIHPHFLFNTLNSLLALSDIDTERMRDLGDAFATYLRVSFDFLNTGRMVSLVHELDLVQAYLYIEKERFEDRLSVEWEVEPGLGLLLPPLSIQPLVENAVKHGLLSKNSGGRIRLRISRLHDGNTAIEVEDNGKGMEPEQAAGLLDPDRRGKGGVGLLNTHRRLIQLYGQGLSIISKPNEGTKVSFIVPERGKGPIL